MRWPPGFVFDTGLCRPFLMWYTKENEFKTEKIIKGVRHIMLSENIKNSKELEFAVFCIENVAARLGVKGEVIFQAFTEKSDILNGYIVPEYESLHTQSREYIVDELLDVMKERGVEVYECKSDFASKEI